MVNDKIMFLRFARNIFRRQNILTLLAVMIGTLAIFGVPQKFGFTTDQLILGLLIFIALESLILKVGYLEQIEELIRILETRTANPTLDQLISPVGKNLDLSVFIGNAKNILVCGQSLERFIMDEASNIEKLARKRCKIRFVVTAPDAPFLGCVDLRMSAQVSEDVQRANITAFLGRIGQLYRRLDASYQKNIEVKTYSGLPFYSGIKILNKAEKADVIVISFYSYGKATGERRKILLTPSASPQSYEFYNESLENLWGAATPVDPQQY